MDSDLQDYFFFCKGISFPRPQFSLTSSSQHASRENECLLHGKNEKKEEKGKTGDEGKQRRSRPRWRRRPGAAQLLLEPDPRGQRWPRHTAGGSAAAVPVRVGGVVVVLRRRDVAVVVHAPPPRELHARKHLVLLFSEVLALSGLLKCGGARTAKMSGGISVGYKAREDDARGFAGPGEETTRKTRVWFQNGYAPAGN